MIIGFTNGCFDLFHDGHKHLLRECMKRCDTLIVAVNLDASVRAIKGAGRPCDPVSTRVTNVCSALRDSDIVTTFHSEGMLTDMIEAYKPNIIFKGREYAGKNIIGHHVAHVELIDMLPGISTTKLIEERG